MAISFIKYVQTVYVVGFMLALKKQQKFKLFTDLSV